jgi:hypothetical protein
MTDKKPNSFAGAMLSRLASARSTPQQAIPTGSSRPSTRTLPSLPRFGQSRTDWEVFPTGDTLVRFSLDGLGGSLRRFITSESAVSGSYQSIIQSLHDDPAALSGLTQALNQSWESYALTGAMLVYPHQPETDLIVAQTASLTGRRPVYLRATDPLLVLNVLARARVNLLQPRAALSFDEAQLNRPLLSDDSRLIQLVQHSGYIEEAIPQQPEASEEVEE